MSNPLFQKFNQSQNEKRQAEESLKKIKELAPRTSPQSRVKLMHEIQGLRQRLKGKNQTLDKTLSKLANDAQKNVVGTHAGARKKVLDALAMLAGGEKSGTSRVLSALSSTLAAGVRNITDDIEQTVNLVEQLSPQLFGTSAKTPEQAGGTRIDEEPPRRRIIPEQSETWQGMQLLPGGRVEIRAGGFRGRYNQNDPEITGEMVRVQSSNVHSIGFQMNLKAPARSQLIVKYLQGKTGAKSSGPTYAYKNVHPRLFRQFMVANSKGKFVWDELRIRGTVAGSQYEYVLTHISGGYLPRRAIIQNGIQILKRRQRVIQQSGRTIRSQKRDKVIGPYRPARGTRPNVGNPDRGRPNRGR